MIKIGCHEKKLTIPLFSELCGFGMFASRRNTGPCGDLYCRAVSLNDGEKRALIISTDTCTMDDSYAREMRAKLASMYSIHPDYITFTATHTHSAPALQNGGFMGYGIADAGFQEYWKQSVMEVADIALHSEEEIEYAETGKAPVSMKLGVNRVNLETDHTDETIRWVKFVKPDGKCKILLHSHGLHGITMNGHYRFFSSSDWSGAADQMIKDEQLAEMPLFFLGPCGDINAKYSHMVIPDKGDPREYSARFYISDLKKSLASGGEKITDLILNAFMDTYRLPEVKQSVEEIAADAERLRSINSYEAERAHCLEDMIIRINRGDNLTSLHDFQVLKIGPISFLFIPGEFFIDDGCDLMKRSLSEHAFAVTVANGNGGYYPSEETMKRYPTIDSKGEHGYGYYEVYGYPTQYHFKYADNIAEYVKTTLLNIEKNLTERK